MSKNQPTKVGDDSHFAYHISLLNLKNRDDENDKSVSAPIFTGPLLRQPNMLPSQFGLLAGLEATQHSGLIDLKHELIKEDPRVFFNVSSPSSTFICGSQGSGKSHTLSCLLEGCLIKSKAGCLKSPLTAVVFHYDTFIYDNGGSPCEAAFLASHSSIKVRVLCAPTNLRTIQGTYARLRIPVEPLQIDQADLNTKRMLDLMAVGQEKGAMPLYMHTVQRILREMRLLQQETGSQLEPLKQRLDTLESFMPRQQVGSGVPNDKKGKNVKSKGSCWTLEPSLLTIVDLSCPCISPDTACSLFNVCFEIFMEQNTRVGRVVALDEAHKYMKSSIESQNFTNTLLSTVRLQRHLGVRVIISTQEPTISSDLLSLCSVTIVHKFSSPAWLRALQGHVAAAAIGVKSEGQRLPETEGSLNPESSGQLSFFHQIVNLRVGEALLFAPGAILATIAKDSGSLQLKSLGAGYMKVQVRQRLTEDGGKSVLSS
ncbi:hypothetical protein N7468_004390 [Penicillium chermesinum]|uniref:Uncharacterized protein n=1 Tax=Penicillium chermesinum TaxID=63820 RepID=A0A9W9P938_9EURO|nr:uncharacterized protein N7468_004390 [Penicillium chermesinum]KAJ5239771.1 hypothetical protein N7468_004390 [Penicillium chermesinum]KAJ6166650.1 hypothetical protein N7470_002097 [Penicillium chermesinum]